MHTFRNRAAATLVAMVAFACATTASHAQFFIGADSSDRQLLPGRPWLTTACLSHTATVISLAPALISASVTVNWNTWIIWIGWTRRRRFGYRIPTPPAFLTAPAAALANGKRRRRCFIFPSDKPADRG